MPMLISRKNSSDRKISEFPHFREEIAISQRKFFKLGIRHGKVLKNASLTHEKKKSWISHARIGLSKDNISWGLFE